MDQSERVEKIRTIGDKDAVIRELDRLIDVHRRIEKENHPVETRYRCANITAAILVEIAMDWHLRAVGGGHEINRQDTMRQAIRLYDKILAHFTAEQMASFQYPRLSKIDWPSRWKIQYAVADLHYFLKDWEKCGPAFDTVVVNAPDKRIAEEAVFAAALCYHNHYEATHSTLPAGTRRKLSSDPPRELTAMERAMIAAWDRFQCMKPPGRDDADIRELKAQLKHARGSIHMDARRWEEAAVDFREAAMSGADGKRGALSAVLYLEALNVLGSVVMPPQPRAR